MKPNQAKQALEVLLTSESLTFSNMMVMIFPAAFNFAVFSAVVSVVYRNYTNVSVLMR